MRVRFIKRVIHSDACKIEYRCPVCKRYPPEATNMATMFISPTVMETKASWEEVLDDDLDSHKKWLADMEKKQ